MKLKKLAAFALTVLIAISALSITAFATDPIGTNPIKLTDGKKTSASIPYDKSNNLDNGHNYADFKYTAASDGTLSIKFDAAIDNFYLKVYDSDKQEVLFDTYEIKTGLYNDWGDNECKWSKDAGLCSGTFKYKVKKGTYYIRMSRRRMSSSVGISGNGRVHITCEMELPKAPTNIKTSVSGTTVKFSWTEPKGCTTYDLRYRVSGTEKWTVKKNINDNNVTIKNLKGSTNYEYQMRSYSGKTVGNWGKTGKFKTSGAAYSGKLSVPSASSVTIKWKDVSNASGYEIRYKVGNGNWTTKTVSSNSYTINVSAGKTYTYQIRAVNGSNKSDWSANKTISA